MKEAIERLVAVLAAENAALEEMDLAAAGAMLPDRQAALDGLSSNPAAPVPAALAGQLRDLAVTNRRLLERAMRVQSGIIGIVVSAIPKPPATTSYRPTGGPRSSNHARPHTLSARA
jgi:hypothetical protein